MKALRRISAALIGFVFFLAAIFKLMDPVGTGLIIEEYFKFFGTFFLMPCAKALGLAMALAECAVGAALLTDVWHKITGMVTGLFIAFFTILTLVILIANPSMDCGCFGEVVHLTHWQTFLKNIVLALLWALAFLPLKDTGKASSLKYVGFFISVISSALFMCHSLRSLPMRDYTSMSPGVEIMQPDNEYAEEGAPLLSFCDVNGEYADSLVFGNSLMVVSVYDPDKLSDRTLDRVEVFLAEAEGAGFLPMVLVAAASDELGGLAERDGIAGRLYFADRRILMTLNRSNGGVTYIADGQIVGKWPSRKLPERQALEEYAGADATSVMMELDTKPRQHFQAFLLYVFAVMLLT